LRLNSRVALHATIIITFDVVKIAGTAILKKDQHRIRSPNVWNLYLRDAVGITLKLTCCAGDNETTCDRNGLSSVLDESSCGG
jgi:hypothetical protein